ncbi:MAG: 1,4-alpha-glucan branching protein GlgB [Acidimicrobiia bacterium]|nr:1,4-alpha-glucan branching protein GlgB [Acidimicrobiia bacterium]
MRGEPRLWERLGAHPEVADGVVGTRFAVWAPAARRVSVVGDVNGWDPGASPMRRGEDGVWEAFVPGDAVRSFYKYEVVGPEGTARLRADPFAFGTEVPPGTASVVERSRYVWGDQAWMAERARREPTATRLATYEVHLGSWRQGLTYTELAEELVPYVADLGFTAVELLPVAEHPYGPSWGYQVTGFFAPTARFGRPDDFRALVDAFHRAGIAVLVDWVPAHFPKDDWALARFDGTPLYEHADPRRGEHPDWGTLIPDLGRPEVRAFLMASALYWLDELHVDGLRVDAVASVLYRDYSRRPGEWLPNEHGGNQDLEAVSFLQELNTLVHLRCPGVTTIAEESTAWPGVSRPVHAGGLGFGHKWNLGWMHDTLGYFRRDPVHRRHHHDELTFGLVYAWAENFVLALSHDEVVHGKGSLLRKMPGDRGQQLAGLRSLLAWMWAHPGRPLVFMGTELAQEREWASERSLDWELLDDPGHAGVAELVRRLNALAAAEAALWSGDFVPEGFRWIDPDDAEASVYSFLRFDVDGRSRPVACLANLTPTPRPGSRFGVPVGGTWEVLLDTDAAALGGSGSLTAATATPPPLVHAQDVPAHGFECSIVVDLPPLAVLYLAPTTHTTTETTGSGSRDQRAGQRAS